MTLIERALENTEQKTDIKSIFECQRSESWHNARRGMITASGVHKIMGARGLGKTGETYIYEQVAEKLCEWKPQATSRSMDWGIEHEEDARAYYEIATNQEVTEKGFITSHKIEGIGCSPDGLIFNNDILVKGIEIKCPYLPENHLKNYVLADQVELKKRSPEWYWQVMFSMLVIGIDSWDFVSYHPEFTGRRRMSIMEVERDEKEINIIIDRLNEAFKFMKGIEKLI